MASKKVVGIFGVLLAILIPNIGGWVGSALVTDWEWYENLNQPPWTPPNWVFGVVWSILYILMGIASYIVWQDSKTACSASLPLSVYTVQLILNWMWTPVFFIYHSILGALIIICLLWALVLVTIILFFRVNKATIFLLLPYCLWVAVATALNSHFYYLNRNA